MENERWKSEKERVTREEGESGAVMACLDIDPGFRDVTTVPQLSTPYTLALCARTYKHSVHTYARVNSGMLRSYVGREHTHIERRTRLARVCVWLWSTNVRHYRRPSGKSHSLFQALDTLLSRPWISPWASRSSELFDYRASSRLINRSADFREVAIERNLFLHAAICSSHYINANC